MNLYNFIKVWKHTNSFGIINEPLTPDEKLALHKLLNVFYTPFNKIMFITNLIIILLHIIIGIFAIYLFIDYYLLMGCFLLALIYSGYTYIQTSVTTQLVVSGEVYDLYKKNNVFFISSGYYLGYKMEFLYENINNTHLRECLFSLCGKCKTAFNRAKVSVNNKPNFDESNKF